MLILLLNMFSGLILAEPAISKVAQLKEPAGKLHSAILPYQIPLGVVTFAVGILYLIDPMNNGSHYFRVGNILQIVAALTMGLLLAENFFRKYKWSTRIIEAISPWQVYIGMAGFLIGLSGIL